ncbi:phosphatidylinositol transporter, putative [Talaromyces stipitatus ATCC 10500]|uniref:Phosphatidylinositol transporter, putative n=1 Tax=Talaromyces stipitatus (strain ATCC 10500 / CBS 375.48 / QM 6759 / NRRL 1006) TaxID=441959 RepID=B8MD46_TALSN|nr:phosphatidylinositol transporter, putative [Talaromyces stipitatus ATCC 10500]EED17571.1 phosphatidylinositol transporter, putative [Talaromyces stipitatus ATCC 10500]
MRFFSRKQQQPEPDNNNDEQPPTEGSETKGDLSKIAAENDLVASANQASGTAWLAGHLNHLTPEQEEKLVEFKALVEEKGYYKPRKDETGVPSHSDATLLRFLRARKFDVQGAYKQFSETEDWRKENKIDDLYENIRLESYERTRQMYPQWTGRRDRRGIPVYLFEVKHLTNKNVSQFSQEVSEQGASETHKDSTIPARLLCLFSLYENLLQFVHPLCSALARPNPETPIVSSNNIVDISGVSLMQFWNLRSHMQDASVLSTAHYPETLDRIFIIGAPSFFPTVWNWIKRWFDPVTVSKIFILSSSEVKSTLETFMEPSSIPSQYGGTLDFKWGDLPNMDDAARALAGGLESPPTTPGGKPAFLKGPVRFFDDHIQVLGTDQGKPRRAIIPVPPVKTTEEPVAARTEAPTTAEAQIQDEKVDQLESTPAPVETASPAA